MSQYSPRLFQQATLQVHQRPSDLLQVWFQEWQLWIFSFPTIQCEFTKMQKSNSNVLKHFDAPKNKLNQTVYFKCGFIKMK